MIQVMSYAIDRLCGPKDSFVLKVALSKCDINTNPETFNLS